MVTQQRALEVRARQFPPHLADGAPAGPAERWSVDFVDDALASGAAPKLITGDHGTQCKSRALEDRACHQGVQLDFIRPGEPVERREDTSAGSVEPS